MIGITAADVAIPAPSAREPLARRVARLAARVAFRRVVTAKPHRPLVSFTFDDIPESAAVTGARILEEAAQRGTFYVAGGLIGTAKNGHPFASSAQCAALHRAGHEIGCHTYAHVPVSEQSRDALRADLDRNAAFLAEIDPHLTPVSFAYPYNHTSLGAKRQIQRRFGSCRGGIPGINAGRFDLGFLRGVRLSDQKLDALTVREWIADAVAQNGWLIFFTHDVADDHDQYGCSPAVLRSAIAEALDQGAVVAPVREAMRHVLGAQAVAGST